MRLLYIDASAVSIIIPAIAGVVVGIGSWLFLHFRRAKSKVSKKLGIDENAGKEVEEDIVINDEEQTETKENAVTEDTKKD
ncbi:MAG: hypothetical protein IKH51_11470 [Clostridia bacterium]|jgi:hypothetical protein|nr:hypothetical protein [Clostridia bacterium]